MKQGTLLRVKNDYSKAWDTIEIFRVVGELFQDSILIYLGEEYSYFITLSKYGMCLIYPLNVEMVK
jgi:hypothetical protein